MNNTNTYITCTATGDDEDYRNLLEYIKNSTPCADFIYLPPKEGKEMLERQRKCDDCLLYTSPSPRDS